MGHARAHASRHRPGARADDLGERLRTYQARKDAVFIEGPPSEADFLEPSFREMRDAVDELNAHVVQLEQSDAS
jgi:hypothetical protein